jgi:shikimate dehydrogenase
MPYKEACVEHMDELDGSAEAIGSVNTIVNTGGRLRAYNTDYLAVVRWWTPARRSLTWSRCRR